MEADFSTSMPRILVYEGGKVNDPYDPGGKTNQGITQSTFSSWLRQNGQPVRDVYMITPGERDTIYKNEYWDRVQGDKLQTGLDFVVFDAAVNSGPSQAIKWLQACLPNVGVDGVLGAKTLDVLATYADADMVVSLVEDYCSHRLATLQRLKTWPRYGKGWNARIANGQKTAISWIDTAPEPQLVDLGGIGSAKGNVNGIKPPMISQVTTHLATGATATATAASSAATQVQAISSTWTWVPYLFGALTLLGILAGLVATFAQKAADAALAGTAKAVVDLEADNLPLQVAQAQVKAAATLPPTQTQKVK